MSRDQPQPENDSGAYPMWRECAWYAWRRLLPPHQRDPLRGSGLGLGFGQADHALSGLELATFLEQFNALIALQHAAFGSDRAASFKAGMLAHGAWTMFNEKGKGKRKAEMVKLSTLHQT